MLPALCRMSPGVTKMPAPTTRLNIRNVTAVKPWERSQCFVGLRRARRRMHGSTYQVVFVSSTTAPIVACPRCLHKRTGPYISQWPPSSSKKHHSH